MESYTIAFCKYASNELRTNDDNIYKTMLDICDKVLNNDKEALNIVSKFICFEYLSNLQTRCIIYFNILTTYYGKARNSFIKYIHKIDKEFSIKFLTALFWKFISEVNRYNKEKIMSEIKYEEIINKVEKEIKEINDEDEEDED
ncbi:hypothetical protein M9Y10_040118 [Tritrichomonas musculus]|uniref:Uncharacterized protein n=1 Tax=Tritrichomonas musculus TaxID=1915356 RepID=A0ABR2GR22_9EUKA